jgi:NhaP-type Na+/H+ or K+/H+ antiporter
MRHYAHYNLTETTRKTFLPVAHLLASLSETYVFLILGAAVFIVEDYNIIFLGWTVLACLVGRAAQVYPCGFVTNVVSSATRFELKEMHVQWFAGLRGAVAFMCALSFPQHGLSQNRGVVLTTTVTIAFASMLAMGWPTASCLRFLEIKGKLSEEQKVDLATSEAGTYVAAEDATVLPPRRMSCLSKIKPCLTSLDEKLIKVLMVKDGQEERAAHRKQEKQLERRVSAALLRGAGGPGVLQSSTEEGGMSLQEARPDVIQRRASLPPGAVEGRAMGRRRSARCLVDP